MPTCLPNRRPRSTWRMMPSPPVSIMSGMAYMPGASSAAPLLNSSATRARCSGYSLQNASMYTVCSSRKRHPS